MKDPYAKERAEFQKNLPLKAPKKGVDYFTDQEKEALIKEVVSRIPKPKNGEDVDYDIVFTYVVQEVEKVVTKQVAKIPKAKDGEPGKDAVVDIPAIVASLLKAMPKLEVEGVDYGGIKEYIDKQVTKIKLPPQRQGKIGGGASSLGQLTDVILDGVAQDSKGNYILGGGGASSFLALSDTPASYTGEELKVVRVNAAGDALEFNAPSSGGNAQTADPLSQFAPTTSLQLKDTISDETGSGALVFATSPTLVTPALGTPSALVATNATGTAAGLTAGNVTTNANLTGVVTSTGNATAIANGAISNAMLANGAVANLTGTNSGDNATNTQYSSLVSNANHTGDATGATALTIAANAVTNAKAAQMATKTYKGRTAAGTGNSEDVPVATLKTDLVLVKADVGLANVDNTTDAAKPVSTAQQTALNLKANLASPSLTGTPTAPTQTAGNNSTRIATTAFATTALNLKANIASPTFTGTVVLPNSQALVTPVLGTPTSVTLTNATGLPIAGLVNSTSAALGLGSIELGHATDTTLSRSAAGVLAVEGVVIPSISSTNTITNKRNQPRVSSSASGDITPTKVDFDRYIRTAQSAAITIANPTMDIGEVVAVQLTDNATARAITFGAHYFGLDGLALPTTTTVSKVMTMVLEKVTATKVLVSYVNEA